jgi:outer membrane protein OmpA-like peptidoglycan-associated protein
MYKGKKYAQVVVVTLVAALLAVVVAGCGGSQEQETAPPPQQTAPPPQQTTVAPPPPQQPQGQPSYRPTTEEWVQLPVRILYPSGGSRLDDQARAMIREGHASLVHRTDIVRVRVEGHADGRGTTEANHQLGLDRAQGVTDFLVGELGMPRELFEVVSYGDERPLTSETSAPDRLQNRRVEFSILVRRQAAP